jgi:exodeoxyribonuclease-5
LRRVTDIRENITQKKLPFAKYEKGVFDRFSSDYWLENLIERYKKAHRLEGQDPNSIRALAWSNARVQSVNYAVRTAIYGDHALPYIAGERLVAKDMIEIQHPDGDWRSGAAWKTGSNTVLMYSCDECVIQSVERGSKMIFGTTFEGWFLDVLTDIGDEATIFTPDEKEKSRIIQACGAKKKTILDMHFEDRKRPQAWAIFYKGLNELGLKMSGDGFMRKLQYAFCMTVHQSQGSTFKTTFVDVSNICGCQDITLRNKLWYTADSRASQELYELNNF